VGNGSIVQHGDGARLDQGLKLKERGEWNGYGNDPSLPSPSRQLKWVETKLKTELHCGDSFFYAYGISVARNMDFHD